MSDVQISRSLEPIRLFRSDFLEAFTHVRPAAIVAIYVPALAVALWHAIRPGAWGAHVPPAIAAGLFLWTLAEYTLHRYVFHFRPRNAWQERVSFLMHGVHHAQPRVKSRLVMPPPVSIPLAALFYGLFALLAGVLLDGRAWVAPLYAGFIAGYLCYDLTYYASHHLRNPGRYFSRVRHYHLRHHSQTHDRRFGVTSPLWDIVFGTRPADT